VSDLEKYIEDLRVGHVRRCQSQLPPDHPNAPERRACVVCRSWVVSAIEQQDIPLRDTYGFPQTVLRGECRAEPPKYDPSGDHGRLFPITLHTDFCKRFDR